MVIPGEQCTRDLDPTRDTNTSVSISPSRIFFQTTGDRVEKTYQIKRAALGLLSDIRADLREVGDVGRQSGSWEGRERSAAIMYGYAGMMNWLTVGALQVREIEDVDGAAVRGGGRTAAEEWRLAFRVAGECRGGCGEGGAGEGDRDDGGEVHGGGAGMCGRKRGRFNGAVVLKLESWLRRWCWRCRKCRDFAGLYSHLSSEICLALAVASFAGDAVTGVKSFFVLLNGLCEGAWGCLFLNIVISKF